MKRLLLFVFVMLETIRKYWIALLVMVLIGLHASIVGLIRHQASLAKIDISCEVDLGRFLAYQQNQKAPLQMQLHAIVPVNHRMKSRQLIELNKAQIRQALEENLRQLDSKFLVDPYLADLKTNLMEVMIQTIGDSSIDDLVITDLRQSTEAASLEFVSKSDSHQPRKMVATLRAANADEHAEEAHEGEEHAEEDGEEHSDDAHDEATDDAGKEHGASKSKASSHGSSEKKHDATAKKASGHGATKKPDAKASSGHGAKKPDAKAASGHGADKKAAPKKSGH